MTIPAPLTPPDCDLRPFRDMPLDIGRFRASNLVTEEEPEAVLAAVLLWGAAWHEVPAASVPDNDRWLAKAAGYGRAVDAWLKVRDAALRGFVRCSDGRLYNRTLAEKANSAWHGRQQYEWRRASDRHRKAQADLPAEQRTKFPPFEQWIEGRKPETSTGPDDLFHRSDDEIPAENAHKGNEWNGMEGNGVLSPPTGGPGDVEAAPVFAVPPDAMKAFRAHRVKIKKPMTDRAEELVGLSLERIWRKHGHDPQRVIDQSIIKGWVGVFPLDEDEEDERRGGRGNRNGGGKGRETEDGFNRAIDRRLGNR